MFTSWWVCLEYLLRMAEITCGSSFKHNSPGKVKLEFVEVF